MKIIRTIFTIAELFYPLLAWLFIFTVYFSFIWFFDEPITMLMYFIPLIFMLCMYAGYFFNGKYDKFSAIPLIKSKLRLIIPSIIGIIPVIMLFIAKIANLDKSLSDIREEHLEEAGKGSFIEVIYDYTFPLLLISFILANFNNYKYKTFVNILAILSCFAFIPINGGRTNFIIFIILYLGIYFFKNNTEIKKHLARNIFKFLGFFLLAIVLAGIYSFVRLGSDADELVSGFYRLQFVSDSGLSSILKLPYGLGITLASFIYTFYDYTGGNVYYFSLYLDSAYKIPYNTYGIYNFSIFDRFTSVKWNVTHEQIDDLYLKSGIKYNVWATSLRELSVDFTLVGAFVFIFILSLIFFYSRKFVYRSYWAQIVFFMLFAFFLYAPFHSMFFIARGFQIGFIFSLIMFIRFRLLPSK